MSKKISNRLMIAVVIVSLVGLFLIQPDECRQNGEVPSYCVDR